MPDHGTPLSWPYVAPISGLTWNSVWGRLLGVLLPQKGPEIVGDVGRLRVRQRVERSLRDETLLAIFSSGWGAREGSRKEQP